MIDFRPDTATYVKVTGGGYNPETGMPNPETTETIEVKGRYDTNVKAFVQRGNDGNYTAPKFVFYMDLDAPVIALETELTAFDTSSGISFIGVVKQFNKGILNSYVLCQ